MTRFKLTLRRLSVQALVLVLVAGLSTTLTGCNAGSGWTRNQIGKRHYSQGNYTAARRNFEMAMIDNPWRADYAFNVAAAMQKQGDLLASERMYQHALTLNPSHQPSYHSLAGMLHEQGRTTEAQELLTAWVETQPYSPESHVELAWMQEELGDYGAAEASLSQALRRNPRHARAAARLGSIYERRGQTAEANAMYRRSVAMNHYQPEVYARMEGMSTAQMGSPAMVLAGQMTQADPTLMPFPQYVQSPLQSAQYGAPTPYQTFMPTGPGLAQQSAPVMMAPSMAPTMTYSPAPSNAQFATPTMMGGQPMPAVTAAPAGQPVWNVAAPATQMPTDQTAVYSPPVSGPQMMTVSPTPTTTVSPGPMLPQPVYSPQPVELGRPVPVSQVPAAAVPAVTSVVPMVPAF